MKFMVAFASPKRSRRIVQLAASNARAMNAEVVLVRVIADPAKVGVVAELIATDTPKETAERQIVEVVNELQSQGINASGLFKVGPVADTLVSTAIELAADSVYIGSAPVKPKSFGISMQDPILHYMVDHCPVALVIARDNNVDENND